MAVTQPEPIQIETNPAQSIPPILAGYRQRIARERRRRYLSTALLVVGGIWVIASLLYYSDVAPSFLLPLSLALTILLPTAAIAYAILRQPSINDTAQALDARLDNQQRLVTSIELLDDEQSKIQTPGGHPKSKISGVQLSTTSDMLARANPKAVYPVRTPWPALLASMGLLMLAMGIFALKGLPGDFAPLQPLGVPGSEQIGSVLTSPTPQSGLPESQKTPDATPTQQVEQSAASQAGQQSDGGSPNPNDPSSQAASQSAQQGLDRLGQGLGEQSISQQAADSLKQGNYDEAAQQLEEIGRENDQMSEGAKRDLADSLEEAALDPNTTPRLRDAAQAAADALRQGDYKDIDEAMRDLGDALKQTAQDVIPQEELAKTFPDQPQGSQPQQGQQGQEGQQNQQGQQGQAGQTPQAGEQGNQQGEESGQAQQGQQSQQGQPQGGQSGQAPQTGEQAQSGGQSSGGGQQNQQNQQGQAGAPGQGTRVGDPTERGDPNVAGNPFEIEGMPDQGRPSNDNERPALTLEGSAASGEAAPASPGNAVTAQGESNNMPVERWEIIQRYFGGGR